MRDHPPPANDAGREMCIAWWTRGACYQNCGRVATHRPFATATERTGLLEYVRERLAPAVWAPDGEARPTLIQKKPTLI